MHDEAGRLGVSAIVEIDAKARRAHVPPLSDYTSVSQLWTEAEFHCVDLRASEVRVGFWTGEPGRVVLDPWPYTEICSIITGRVAVTDLRGGRREFGPAQGFVIPKGFAGSWETLEPSSKVFVNVA